MNKRSNDWTPIYKSAPRIYDKFASAQDSKPLLDLLESMAAIRSKSILDVGTGTGKYARLLASRDAFEVVGIDRCEQMLGLARDTAEREGIRIVSYLQIPAEGLNFLDRFDTALSAWAINAPWDGDYASLDRGLEAIFKSLRSNGRFFLITTPPGELAGELAPKVDAAYLAQHAQTKGRFVDHLKNSWSFKTQAIRADWNFNTVDEAALCFGLLYAPEMADAILEMSMKTVKANALALVAEK